jgi:tetratricopeptide (TPR) repeat protein
VHRDLKPANVLLASGAIVGTPSYMAPEQAFGQTREIGPAADVYALGAILYELLTGRPPFKAATPLDTLLQVVCEDPVPPSRLIAKLPRDLETICLKCLQKEPRRRFASAQTLAEDLRRFGAGEPIVARPVGHLERTVKWVGRNKALAAFLAALVLLLVGGSGVALWYQGHRAEEERRQALSRAEAKRKRSLTEQAVRQGLDQAQRGHAQLLATLKKPGGVQDLLNQPARWEAQLQAARGDWRRANALAANEGSLAPDLADRLSKLDRELGRDQADYELAQRLDKIRLDRATSVGRYFDFARAEREYPRAFEDAGLAVAPGRLKEVARRIGQSAIRDQLLAALDEWAWLAHKSNHPDLCRRLLELARRADPDPWRGQVRNPKLWTDSAAVEKLADAVQSDRAALARLSPQMMQLVAFLLPQAKKEQWLRRAQAQYPADFWLNFELAALLEMTRVRAAEAAGFYRVALAIRPNTPGVYNNLGNALRFQKDFPAAIDAYQKAVALDPRCVHAWFNLGVMLRELHQLPAALAAARKTLALDPQYSADAWYNLGLLRCDLKDTPAAITAFHRALALDPRHTSAWDALGSTLHEQKDLPAAIKAYNKALAIDPKQVNVWNNLGYTLHSQKNLPAAINAYKRALAVDPKHVRAWSNLGHALYDRKDLAAAADAFRKAVASDPKYSPAWINLGHTLYAQNQLPPAIDAFQKALALTPSNAQAWYYLGEALRRRNDVGPAIAAYQKAVTIDPRDARGWIRLGDILRDQKDLPAASEAYKKVVTLEPGNAGAWNTLAGNLCAHKDWPGAIDAYRKLLALEPQNARAWCDLGNALSKRPDLPAALAACRRAAAIDPKNVTAWHNIGVILYRQKDLPGTVAAYRKALAIDPKYAACWTGLANALDDQKDFPGALAAYKKALAIEPKNARAWLNLGIALRGQKDLPGAVEAYKKALALDPRYAAAWINLGHALDDRNDLPAAIDAYRKGLALDGKSFLGWYHLGHALYRRKDHAAAVDAYRKALALDGGHARAWVALGVNLDLLKDHVGAIDAYKKALALDPTDGITWYRLGGALSARKDLPAAVDAYKTAIRYKPALVLAEAHCNMGHTLRDLGELGAALAALEKGHQLGTQTNGWSYPSADWVNKCRQLLALDQQLNAVLKGQTATTQERLRLAEQCARSRLRCADAVALYAATFAAEPRRAEDLGGGHRYNAACAAAMAAAGQGIGPGPRTAKGKARLCRQALAWLQADLAARARLLDQKPLEAFTIQFEMQHWQGDADLAGVRGEKELARLPAEERASWTKLWAEVAALRHKARARYVETVHQGQLDPKQREQPYPLRMTAGKTYVIELASQQFNASLRLHDDQGKVVAENDDISKGNPKARIVFMAPRGGTYRIVATCSRQRGVGGYTLTIREFGPRKQ